MQRLIDLTTVSARHRELFSVYLSDSAFRRYADDRLLAPHRISLATLAGPRPDGFGDRAIGAKLYDMRFRFSDALRELGQAHEAFTEHPFRSTSGRAGRPSEPSGAARQTGAGATMTLSSATGRHPS